MLAHDAFLAADDPKTVPAAEAGFLRDDDEVYGIVVAERARAYSICMLEYHHVVNDVMAGTPVAVTYWVVCSSGISFDPMLDGKRLTFGFEGVWQGTAILYDRDTGSIWMHFTGTCFAGPRAGRTLKMLATGTHTTWAAWRRDHPDTDVMAVDPRFASRYVERVAAKSGEGSLSTRFDRTITWRDPRLPLGELLLGVRVEGAARAYPLARLSATAGVVEETIALVPVTVWYETRARTAVAFERRQAGIFEHDTGSRFDADGRCVEGPLLGRRLVRLPSLLTEWYGWFVHHPETSIFGS